MKPFMPYFDFVFQSYSILATKSRRVLPAFDNEYRLVVNDIGFTDLL
jgi:hypothetical protein